jgi:hypothetical protein
MTHDRGRLLDALTLMSRGHYLVRASDSALGTYICGQSVVDLFDVMRQQNLIARYRGPCAFPGLEFYVLSAKGLDALERGQRWWASLSFWKRVRVRLLG